MMLSFSGRTNAFSIDFFSGCEAGTQGVSGRRWNSRLAAFFRLGFRRRAHRTLAGAPTDNRCWRFADSGGLGRRCCSYRLALARSMKPHDNAELDSEIHEPTQLDSDSRHDADFFDNLFYVGYLRQPPQVSPRDNGQFAPVSATPTSRWTRVSASPGESSTAYLYSVVSAYTLFVLSSCRQASGYSPAAFLPRRGKPTDQSDILIVAVNRLIMYRCSTKIRFDGL